MRVPLLPGSALKPFTALALLRSGAITTTSRLRCLRVTPRYGARYACVHARVRHALDLEQALALSCNYYFLTVSSRLRDASWRSTLAQFGLTPDGASGSAAGDVGTRAIGAEGIHVTALQLLEAYRRLALLISRAPHDRQLRAIGNGLRGCVRYGSCRQAAVPGWNVAGKTGTIAELQGGPTHAWFAGYAPAARPSVLIVVATPKGTGSADAAKLGGEVLRWMHRHPSSWNQPPSANAAAAPPAQSPHAPGLLPKTVLVRETARQSHGGKRLVKMPLETYVAGVVQGEAQDLPFTAQVAMAVLARTWVLTNRGRHAARGFDFCTTTHCQDWQTPRATAWRATRRTTGQVLLYHGRPVQVFYSEDCGGRTETVAPGYTDGKRLPYLRGHPDPFCLASPDRNWSSRVSNAALIRALLQARILQHRPSSVGVAIAARDRDGRATRILLTPDGGRPMAITAARFRFAVDRTLGWSRLKSTWFTLHRTGNDWIFNGHGLGHGAGLCQAGAAGMARRGASYASILAFYYPGTRIAYLDQPTAQVSLQAALQPAAEHGRRWHIAGSGRCEVRYQGRRPSQVVQLCGPLLRQSERELHRRLRGKVLVSVFPTTAAFLAAGGRSGWLGAAANKNRIALQPEPLLLRKGLLRNQLHHDLLHVVMAGYLRPHIDPCRQEGAVLLLTGESKGVTKTAYKDQDSAAGEPLRILNAALSQARSHLALQQAYRDCYDWVAARAALTGKQQFLDSILR